MLDTVITPPPPIPAIALARISDSIDDAMPHNSVPKVNNAKARSIADLRPRISASLPAMDVRKVSEYQECTRLAI